jgi:3-phosphoglycerate kinase
MKHSHFPKKTIKDIAVHGKTILLRADFNVPLHPDGTIAGDYRITQTLPTLQYLLERKCKIIIISHLGRPKGKPNKKEGLKNVAALLQKDLPETTVQFVPSTLDDAARLACKNMKSGSIVVLENLRFDPREEENDSHFAHELQRVTRADYFVQDGFGVVHRAHASTEAITHLIPSVAGLLLEKEVATLAGVMSAPKHPVVAIIGGAKISDKIEFIHRLLSIADTILIGGAMANTFLAEQGITIGKSRTEAGQESAVRSILAAANEGQIILPSDLGVASTISENAQRRDCKLSEVTAGDYILDLGPKTTKQFCKILGEAATVIWNGTLGMTELPAFQTCSAQVAEVVFSDEATSVIGGGDTADFVLDWQQKTKTNGSFSHISTGGGASLELMSGSSLPGVEALLS